MFEYKIVGILTGGHREEKLNELGAEGWELLFKVNLDFYFKRSISPGPAQQ